MQRKVFDVEFGKLKRSVIGLFGALYDGDLSNIIVDGRILRSGDKIIDVMSFSEKRDYLGLRTMFVITSCRDEGYEVSVANNITDGDFLGNLEMALDYF